MRALHDYGFETERHHRDVILGHWIHVDPQRAGPAGVKELRRCIDKRIGFLGFAVSASLSPPASDPLYQPYYDLCTEAGIPVLIFVGTTGLGAGLPGGAGVILDYCHPRHLDWVAAHNPQLKIVAARPGWPWQAEVIAVLLHKRNIWYELTVGHRSTTRPTSSTRSRVGCRIASCLRPTIRCSPMSASLKTGARKAIQRRCLRRCFGATPSAF